MKIGVNKDRQDVDAILAKAKILLTLDEQNKTLDFLFN